MVSPITKLCESPTSQLMLLNLLKEKESSIQQLTQDQFGQILSIIEEGVNLIFTILLCCSADDKIPVLDRSGKNEYHAVVTKMMRHGRQAGYLCHVITDLTARGHYATSLSLSRTLVEETIKALFYAYFPDEAVKHLKSGSKESKELDYRTMAKRLGYEIKGLDKFVGGLHKFVHASPLASFTIHLLPEFNQQSSYTILIASAIWIRAVIKALSKAFRDEFGKNLALDSSALSLIKKVDELESQVDTNLYQLSIVTSIDI